MIRLLIHALFIALLLITGDFVVRAQDADDEQETTSEEEAAPEPQMPELEFENDEARAAFAQGWRAFQESSWESAEANFSTALRGVIRGDREVVQSFLAASKGGPKLDDVAILCVNDPFVMRAWGESTGAIAAGVRMLADSNGTFSQALGLTFSKPDVGLYDRSRRFSMLVDDGVVEILNVEPGAEIACSTGEALLEQI